ncbi:hypothetical protein ACEQ8H_008387 [Pleosporales sp. CAS-2024a]
MSCQVIDPVVQAQTAGDDWTQVGGHLQATFNPAASDDCIIPLDNSNYMDAFHLGPAVVPSTELENQQHPQYFGGEWDTHVAMTPSPQDLSLGNTPQTPPCPIRAFDFSSSEYSDLLQPFPKQATPSSSLWSESFCSSPLTPTNLPLGHTPRSPATPTPIRNMCRSNATNPEAFFSGTFLDFLRKDDPTTHAALAGILATRGYKLAPISKADRKRRNPSDLEGAVPKRKRPLSSFNWWGRFLKITQDSSQLQLREEEQALVDDPTSLLREIQGKKTRTADMDPDTGGRDNAAYGKLFLYTMSLEVDAFRNNVMQIVMRLFYFVISHNSISDFTNNSVCRLPSLFPQDIDKLHKRMKPFLPSDCATLAKFQDKDLIAPAQLWACTKGAERSGISESAFEHLVAIGVPARAACIGADKLVHTLLWKVCAMSPGFPKRKKNKDGEWEAFPGFDYVRQKEWEVEEEASVDEASVDEEAGVLEDQEAEQVEGDGEASLFP